MAYKKPRVLRELEKLNPDLEVKRGTLHFKLIFQGQFIGIYPVSPKMEGLADNTKRQLARAGVRLR